MLQHQLAAQAHLAQAVQRRFDNGAQNLFPRQDPVAMGNGQFHMMLNQPNVGAAGVAQGLAAMGNRAIDRAVVPPPRNLRRRGRRAPVD
ncbi:hypothetical protein TREMEDRAFT_57128 [Tremella mesenterica DSM 1558]|uniref:uncharacterized protein n=1 Tax=Tremella mesenterica (strain ATCC 24925 / CBS 8224 / DSM 1558 / NBRC 9311 / NRRL Y-6157 / RJB 2259-6 / UBC 559-6) TaxID=578456 RepID=UPI0003F49F9C|nr:uncharacterized protein TREMEDRAFT_57128 [Tremella mesenterica DSM 1558]EIW69224.1 hypothetical protein TREMEDRAFT_57128 [Tremella mesenterica DSM 1558]